MVQTGLRNLRLRRLGSGGGYAAWAAVAVLSASAGSIYLRPMPPSNPLTCDTGNAPIESQFICGGFGRNGDRIISV